MKIDFDSIKRTTDIVETIQRYGVALKKVGQNHIGLCPFHNDTRPSLRVTRNKGLFHCMACGAAGNVIQFVAKKEGLTQREAAVKLCASIPGVNRGDASPLFSSSELFNAALEYYHETLLSRDRRGLDYLKKRGLIDIEVLRHFKIGFVNGSINKKLSAIQRQSLPMLLNEAGNERFYLRVVVPIFDEHGQPVGLYGRSIQNDNEIKHLYLSGEHRAVWNGAAAAAYPDGLIVTESIIDGLAIFQAGHKNVIACYGVNGWTPHHDSLIKKHTIKKIIFAFDADECGQKNAHELAVKLNADGIHCHRIQWPQGIKDACDYFQYHRETDFKGTAETFTSLLAVAPRIGFTREACAKLSLVEQTDEITVFQNGSVSYRIKNLSTSGGMRAVLTAKKDNIQHVDHLDLYGNKARKMFSTAAAERLQIESHKIENDLLMLLEMLEQLKNQQSEKSVAVVPVMNEAEREEALRLLRSPRLLERIASDLELIGYVGEGRNKKLSYLIATSRRLPKPLSCIFRAQSGCGKSFLMECVADLMPPEDVHYFSRLTPQALYYLEPDTLKHKLLIVDERDGSEEAEYPIRTLQTRRILKLAVPVKDPNSGRIRTVVLEIHGPIAYMESTTEQRINPENANRCFELYLDETEKQTRAILAAQKKSRTLQGWRNERRKADILRLHHNAQRLLGSLKVLIPYVELIDFPASWLRGRRDNDRFLSLIEGVAFLHQHQRKIQSDGEAEYIEANLDDYAIAYDLAHLVFAQSGSDLPKPVSEFLNEVEKIVRQKAKAEKCALDSFTFSRRDIREAIKLPDHIVKRYMRQIEELEYIQVERSPRGGSFRYRLSSPLHQSGQLQGLITPDALREKWNKWNKTGTR